MVFQTYRSLALAKALTQVGVKESPPDSNDGPQVRAYQSVTGAYRAAWCASFVQWCFKEVGMPQPLFSRSAYVPFIVATARSYGWVVAPNAVQPGDLACYDWEGDGVADHIGIVKTAPVNGAFTAVEGNTGTGNDSNGGEVMVRDRTLSEVQAFIRVPGRKSLPAPKPNPKPLPQPPARQRPQYYTFKKAVPLQPGQTVGYVKGLGYFADPTYYTYVKDVPKKPSQVVKFRPGYGYYAAAK